MSQSFFVVTIIALLCCALSPTVATSSAAQAPPQYKSQQIASSRTASTSRPCNNTSSLQVGMFSYIPDASDAYVQRISNEAQVSASFPDGGATPYDVEGLIAALNTYDVLEIDSIFLGALVARGAVKPLPRAWLDFGGSSSSLLASARTASFIGNTLYGVPHWSCGLFIHTTARSVSEALNQPFNCSLDVAGQYSPWDETSVFIDQQLAVKPNSRLSANALPSLTNVSSNSAEVQNLKRIIQKCSANAPITPNGTFTSVGYHERLRELKVSFGVDTSKLLVAPLASLYVRTNKETKLSFTDVFVVSARCNASCMERAGRFVRYINRVDTFEWILNNRDNAVAPSIRYLIPAYQEVLTNTDLKKNKIYKNLQKLIPTAQPIPFNLVPDPAVAVTAFKEQLDQLLN